MFLFGALIPLIVLGLIGWGIIALVRRGQGSSDSEPDFVAYGLLLIAMGVVVYSLMNLVGSAFAADSLVQSGSRRAASALAGLVVAGPVAFLLWRRQATRRLEHPESTGWSLYLFLAEAVFTTTLVVILVLLFDRWFGDGTRGSWTDALVLAGVFAFHEWASKDTSRTGIPELRRMAGSFIGVVTTSIGFGMVLYALLTPIYESVHPSVSTGGFMPAAAILVVGGALWYYRWWLRGTEPTTPPMRFYATTVSWASLVTAIATVATVISSVLIFVFDSTEDAGFFFRFLPAAISVLGVALGVWAVHHPRLKNQVDSLRSYEYLMAASGLIAVVASGTVMTTFALRDASFIEGGRRSGVLAAFTALVIAATTWWWFWSGRQRAERPTEAQSRPRRTYVIAMAVVAGLAAAEALIAVLVIAFQGLFGLSPNTTTLATQAALAILAGAATTHLLLTNRDDQRHLAAKTVELPTFDVTIVCTDLGMLESLLPDEASLTVIGRGDQKGYISDEMAARIAEAVGRNRSIIWVEDGQFRIAPQPTSDDTTTSPDTVPTSPS